MKKKWIFLLLLLGCIAFIWGNSLQDGIASTKRSEKVTEIVNGMNRDISASEQVIRKLAHFSEFCVEGICIVLVFAGFGAFKKSMLGNMVLTGVLTALVDETIQLIPANRSSQVTDVWIDTGGVLAGIMICFLMIAIYRKVSYNDTRCR